MIARRIAVLASAPLLTASLMPIATAGAAHAATCGGSIEDWLALGTTGTYTVSSSDPDTQYAAGSTIVFSEAAGSGVATVKANGPEYVGSFSFASGSASLSGSGSPEGAEQNRYTFDFSSPVCNSGTAVSTATATIQVSTSTSQNNYLDLTATAVAS